MRGHYCVPISVPTHTQDTYNAYEKQTKIPIIMRMRAIHTRLLRRLISTTMVQAMTVFTSTKETSKVMILNSNCTDEV